jgi:hypothetical protein
MHLKFVLVRVERLHSGNFSDAFPVLESYTATGRATEPPAIQNLQPSSESEILSSCRTVIILLRVSSTGRLPPLHFFVVSASNDPSYRILLIPGES